MACSGMRAAIIMLGLGIGSALAAPPSATWGDWAGGYQGSLTWSSCTVAGARSVTLALDFVDGIARIDLASTRPGMPALTLVEEAKGWSGRQGDVAVSLTRTKPNTLDLAVELDSGCLVRGRLTRRSTGVAACDQLIGWARVDAKCTKHTPVEDLAKLLATTWKKPGDAARCASRAATLEHALIDAGCAPHPDPKIGVRSPDCLDLVQVAARLSRCATVLPDLKTVAVSAAQAIISAALTAERATLPVVEQQCRDTRAELIAIATQFRCP